jgi:predicted dehydrogenase
MESNDPICRWGILSAAGIAKKNWRAMLISGNSRLVAVAARDLASAQSFIADCQSHSPLTSRVEAVAGYDRLLERADVDAVYIPLPTAIRGPWIRKALEAGKHVLAEKPAGVDASEVRGLIELARARNLQFMDGVMFMHSHRLKVMRRLLDQEQKLGKLHRMAAHFSFRGDDDFFKNNIRSKSQFEPHGCLGDLGWYCIRAILWAKNYQLPRYVAGRTLSEIQGVGSPKPVPSQLVGELYYADGFSANFFCSFETENQQWFHLSGSEGNLSVKDFVLPFYGSQSHFEVCRSQFAIDGCDFHMHAGVEQFSVPEYSEGHPGAQECEMFRTFSELVVHRRCDTTWGDITLATQRVMDAIFDSANQNSAVRELA